MKLFCWTNTEKSHKIDSHFNISKINGVSQVEVVEQKMLDECFSPSRNLLSSILRQNQTIIQVYPSYFKILRTVEGGREGELSFNYSIIISNRFRVKNVSARMALKFLIF